MRVVHADLPFFVSVLQAQGIHGAHDCSQGLDGVAVNHRLVLLYIITGETVLMDDPGHKERLVRLGNSESNVDRLDNG